MVLVLLLLPTLPSKDPAFLPFHLSSYIIHSFLYVFYLPQGNETLFGNLADAEDDGLMSQRIILLESEFTLCLY